jgi:hypothetical protein
MKKLTMLIILILGLSIHSSAFAATKSNTVHLHYKQMYLTLPHTIRTSFNRNVLTYPRTNKIINHIKVSKSYKTAHTAKIISYKPHTTALKHTTIHYPKYKPIHFKITHVSYHSTFHPAKIKTISYHRHKI